jgi:hypothetical protein
MSDLETKIVKPFIKEGKISQYCRYVDDSICWGTPEGISQLFEEMNDFYPTVKFTRENPIDDAINFLDMTVFKSNETGLFETKTYQKPTKSNVLINFKKGIMPLSYKISILSGEIFRYYYTNSTPELLEASLKNLKEKFLRNGYPRNLICDKIKEAKGRNFQTRDKSDLEKRRRECPESFHTFTANFTDFSCEKLARKIKSNLRKLTPDFSINIAWSSTTFDSVIIPALKRKPEVLETSNLIYKFDCVEGCPASYVGETARLLRLRCLEHGRNTSTVYSHIRECPKYIRWSNIERAKPGMNAQRALQTRFTKVCSNLTNYFRRQVTEAFVIRLLQPSLNEQVVHRSVSFL